MSDDAEPAPVAVLHEHMPGAYTDPGVRKALRLNGMPVDELAVLQASVGHELLSDWYMKPAEPWQALPLDLFPDIKLRDIAAVANAGVSPRDLPIGLQRNGSRAWPHPGDAEEFVIAIRSRALPRDSLIAELQEISQKRALRVRLLKSAEQITKRNLDEVIADLESLRPPEAPKPFDVMPIDELFEPLGPDPWLSEVLALQPGAPWMLSGNSGRGKSWLMTDLALAIASGQKFAGCPVRAGRVRWIHLEGSRRDFKKRSQMLAMGRQLGRAELGGQFLPSIYPPFNFQDPGLEKRLLAECTGVVLCVIDTFAVAAAGMKEVDSSIRMPLDMLGRVSEKTGCAFAVIHHHRKDPQDSRQKVDLEQMTRGSGAITNALSASWAITRLKRTDKASLFRSKLTLGKSWYGERDALIVEAIHSHFVPGGVDLHVDRAPEDDASEQDSAARDYAKEDQLISDTLAKHPGGLTFNALAGLTELRRQVVRERLEVFLVLGKARREDGKRGAQIIRPPGSA